VMDMPVEASQHASVMSRTALSIATLERPDRLLLGADWPIGEADPVGFVNRCPGHGSLSVSDT
jgi:hypothetical protein